MAQQIPVADALSARSASWLGGGAWWADSEILQPPWIAICGSRLGRQLHRMPHVFSLLRATLLRSRRSGRPVVWCAGTAVDACVTRGVQLLNVLGLRLHVCDWSEDDGAAPVADQLCNAALQERACPSIRNVFIGPPSAAPQHPRCPLDQFPRRDCAAVGLADEVAVLHVRRGGAVERLVEARLSESPARAASVRVPATTSAGQMLMKQGAIGWCALHDPEPEPQAGDAEYRQAMVPRTCTAALQQLVATAGSNATDAWPYVVHCTRSADGSTPGFPRRWLFDQLILGEPVEPRTALANLIHILRSGRLCGTRQLTRSSQPVVCFSAVPLLQLTARRRFRSHLGRWDYEPYGIGIRQDCLRRLGGRPVRYVDAQQMPASEDDATFLQPRGRDDSWTEEQEWRLVGDLGLRELGADEAFVFVAEPGDVGRVRPWTNLPVIAVKG